MNNVYGCIYGIWNPDRTKIYVGQTTKTPAKRWAGHVRFARAKRGCPRLGAAIRKYGDQMIVEPLDVAECQADLDFLETFYICVLDAITNGYNCRSGGIGSGGRLLDEEAKKRVGAGAKTGLAKMTEEERAMMFANRKVALAFPEVQERYRNNKEVGRAKMAEEARVRMLAGSRTGGVIRWAREAANGRVLRSPEVRERGRLYMQKYAARRKAEGRPYVPSPEAKERTRQRRQEYRTRKRAEKASQASASDPVNSSPASVTA